MATKKPARGRAGSAFPIELRKAHEAIFVRPMHGGKLELLKRKAYNALLHNAQRKGADKSEYSISIGELAKSIGFDSNNYDALKDYLRQLQGTQVEWDFTTDKGGSSWGVSSMLSRVEIINHGMIHYAFDEKMKARLLDPEIFSRIDMRMVALFKSGYSLALYEACNRYKTNPSGVTSRLPWTTWRSQICGDESSLYDEFKYFNGRVLKRALAEINAVSDLEVEVLITREGRSVTDLQFKVTQRQQNALELHPSPHNAELKKKLRDLGLNDFQISDVFATKEDAAIEATIDYVEKRAANKRLAVLENIASYFMYAINRNLAPMKDKIIDEDPDDAKARKAAAVAAKLRQRFNDKRAAEARGYFHELDESHQGDLLEAFAQEIASSNKPIATAFRKTGITTPMVESTFFNWLGAREWGEPTDSELLAFALETAAE